jgi:hypothetical protein
MALEGTMDESYASLCGDADDADDNDDEFINGPKIFLFE